MSDPDELKPASRCPTPHKVKTTDLPGDASDDIGPLGLEFSDADGLGLSDTNPEYGQISQAQLYDMNQEFLNDTIPWSRPLISEVEPLDTLRKEYENGTSAFVGQIDWLIKQGGYGSIRRTRGDGDCFYRSFGFAYVESLLHSSDKEMNVAQSLSSIEATKETLLSHGIESLVFEDFMDEFTGLIESIISTRGGAMTPLNDEKLLEVFQNAETSNAIVMYLRLLTSAQIRKNREQYEGFLVHPETKDIMDVESFCANVVQVIGREADNVEIDALCRVLQLNVDVVYLTGVRADSVDVIKFRNDPNEEAKPLVLLYRPGHYDILVSKKE